MLVHNLTQSLPMSLGVLVMTAFPSCVQVAKSEISAGEDVELTLKGTGFLTMEPFMGFILQVELQNCIQHLR